MIKQLIALLLLSGPVVAAETSSGEGSPCCGLIGIIVIIGVIVAKVKRSWKSTEDLSQSDSSMADSSLPKGSLPNTSWSDPQQVMIVSFSQEKKNYGSGEIDCFSVHITGRIVVPSNMLNSLFSLRIYDTTRGDDKKDRQPILCSHPDFQENGSQAFLWTQAVQMPYPESEVSFIHLFTIPIDMLTFPARGKRKLHYVLSIAPVGQINRPTSYGYGFDEYLNESLGYVDGIAIRIKAEELGLKYATAVSAIDGEIDNEEKTVIRKWMDTRIDSLPEDMRAETTRSLSRALMIAERLSGSIKPEEIELLCDDLVEDYPIGSFPPGELYDIVELCMKVAAADGIASPEELRLVDRIASLLHVDMDRFRKMSEKILPVNIHSKKDVASILGLKAEWTAKQRKKHLRDQYREWSARVTHSDAKVRDQADEMLRLIAGERAKIDAEE